VLPLGSGGTAAGLALGLAIAGVESIVVGARVAPRFATGRGRVLYLAARARHFIERHAGARVPRVRASRIEVVHDVYGGAYGRPLPAADDAAALAHEALGVRLDGTYSAKAFAAALALARRGEPRTLFWLTFDARWMQSDEGEG
jgi:D-cysteine desulfhydrase